MKKFFRRKLLLPISLLLLAGVGAVLLWRLNPARTPPHIVSNLVSVFSENGGFSIENQNDFALRDLNAELYRSGTPGSSVKGKDSVCLSRWEERKLPAGEVLRLEARELPTEMEDLYLTFSFRYGFCPEASRNTVCFVLPAAALLKSRNN